MSLRPHRPGRRLRVLAAGAAVVLVAAGCAPSAEKTLGRTTPPPFPTPTPTAPAAPVSPTPTPTQNPQCPTPPAGGGGGGGASQLSWPGPAGGHVEPAVVTAATKRPVVSLCFAFASDHSAANGMEQVTFTPDRKVCKLVFRLWANKPTTARSGSELTITGATVDGAAVTPRMRAAGAPKGSPGTLAELALPACVTAGTPITSALRFHLQLGERGDERVGYDPAADIAWAGTAYPLLAWVPGKGWATDPAVTLYGETTTSTTFDLKQLLVIDNTGDTVMAAGKPGKVSQGASPGTEVHTFSAPAVRDVAVTAGRTAVYKATVHGVNVRLALPKAGARGTPAQWKAAIKTALGKLIGQFGRFPYKNLWVSVLPDVRGGIEYPGAVLVQDSGPGLMADLMTHELAHQWFYGLVGNDQATHPWLDESFAQYAMVLLTGQQSRYLPYRAPAAVRDQVGRSMRWYTKQRDPQLYTDGVYTQGAQMLLEVRRAVGPTRFNRLLRGYIKANAHRIATPASVKKAFAASPKAIKIFERFGAFG